MLLVALGAGSIVVALMTNARGFFLGGSVVFLACVLQPDRGFAWGFLNRVTDAAVVMAAYVAIGLALLVSKRMQRTMKAFSRS